MTTLTSSDTPRSDSSNLLVDTKFSLCVTQPGTDDRIIELPMGKSTVGSSERCQVHIADPTAKPLHCLIVREATAISVTRWAAGVSLNGSEFATSPFQPGDQLEIGAVQISLVADEVHAVGSNSMQAESAEPLTLSDNTKSDLPAPAETTPAAGDPVVPVDAFAPNATYGNAIGTQASKATFDETGQLVARLQSAKDNTRVRCRKLVAVLRAMREEANGFDQRVDDLQRQLNEALEERDQIFSQLSLLKSEAHSREQQSAQEIDRLIAELTTAYEKAGTAESALETAGQQAVDMRSELEQQIVEAREQAVAAQAQIELQSQELQTELAELRSQQQEWEQLRSSSELQRNKLAQALADRDRTVETLQNELEQLRHAADQADECRMEHASAVENLQAELELACDDRERAMVDLDAARQSHANLEQSLADSEQNLAVFQLELEKFQLTSRQTEQELLDKTSELEALQVEFAQFKDERDLLVTKRTEYQLREQGWEHEIASRDSKIEELTNEISQLRTSVEEAVQGAASQAAQVEEAKQKLGTVSEERDQLLAAQDEQLQSIRGWEEAVESRDRRVAELEREHEGICEVLQSVEKGAFEQVDACNKLQDQLSALREERDRFANALPEQREYIQQLEQALSERDGQITLLGDELTKTAEHKAALESQLAEGTSSYQALEAEMSEVNARFERQRQELEQTVADESKSSDAIQAEITSLRSQCEQITLDYQTELERRQELDTQLAERDQNLELFQVDLRAVQAELDRTVSQVAELEGERETLKQQLTGLREELASRDAEPSRPDSSVADFTDEATSYLPESSALEACDLPSQADEAADFHDAYADDKGYEVADEYSYESPSTADPASDAIDPTGEVSWEVPTNATHDANATAYDEPASDDEFASNDESDAEVDSSCEPDLVLEAQPEPSSDTALEQQEPVLEQPVLEEPNAETPTADEPTDEPVEEFKPTSFIEQYQHLLEDGDDSVVEPVQPAAATPAPTENRLAAELDAMQTPSDDESDEALQAYMQNMLQRMRGGSDDNHVPPPQADNAVKLNQNPNPVSAVADVLQNVAPQPEPVESEPVEPIDMESLKRSSQKPALPTDLAAMRELANSSARKAIAKHHQRRHLEKAMGLFLVCLIAICVGAYMLLSAVSAQDFLGVNFIGGAIAACIGVVGALKLLKLLLMAIREGSWEKIAAAKSAAAKLPKAGGSADSELSAG